MAVDLEHEVKDSELISLVKELSKDIFATRDMVKHDLKESAAGWAEKSTQTLEKLNELKETQDQQQKLIESFEISASRPMGGVKKGFISKDVITQMKEVHQWGKSLTPYQQTETSIDKYLKVILENEPAMALNYASFGQFRKDVIEGSLPQGGYWVLPFQYLNDTITRIFETSPMRSICRVQTITKPIAFEVIDDQQTGVVSGSQESQSIPNTTTPLIGQVTFPVWNISAVLLVSDQMIQDSNRDIGQWVTAKGMDRIVRTQNTAFVIGSGANEARGILSYATWGSSAVTVGQSTAYVTGELQNIFGSTNATVANTISYDGIVNTQNSLIENYQRDAVWLMHRLTFGQILQIKDTQDRPLFIMQNLLSTGADGLPLMGRRVVFAQDLPSPDPVTGLFSEFDVPIVYGDFREGYSIFDRMGIQVLRDIFTESTEFRVRFILKARYGGGLTSYDRLKRMEIGAA